jgi:hyperosmotically inducible protein
MTRKQLGLCASGLGIMLVAWTCAASAQQGVGERIKENARDAVQAVKKGVVSAEEGMKVELARARTAIRNMGVESRVYGRLHWDKALHDINIDIKAKQEGVITLAGTVPDTRAKTKAIQLTADTFGVVRVVDELIIPAPSTAPASKPIEK